jgi:hypothetical protein
MKSKVSFENFFELVILSIFQLGLMGALRISLGLFVFFLIFNVEEREKH